MRLSSADGAWLDLRVLRRQVVQLRGLPPAADWTANWLLLRGEVRDTGARQWAFREPCLSAWEGQRLGVWLRAAAGEGNTPELRPGAGLVFDEPTLSFAFDAAREDRRLLRVHLAGAGAWTDPAGGRPHGGGVALDVDMAGLLRAAEDWAADLQR